MPDRLPALADFFILDDRSLLVVTFENDDREPTLAGDLFDEQGRYQARVQVPKYKSWYWLFLPVKSLAVFHDHHLYTLEEDASGENTVLKRYRVVREVT